ncbi:hypothetical protein BaRGS_00001554 [Batillaria attramentaria]|uniref:Oxysterol-binding protein n=1 Tax=Batillaria attramentaria TaxID=370345 RepID=A0ABD0M6N3_9CAEN
MKDKKVFEEWLKRLRHHRLYRQHEIAYGSKESPRLTEITSPTEELSLPTLTNANLPELALKDHLKKEVMRQSSFKTSQGRIAAWVLDTAGFDQCNKTLGEAQSRICQLMELLEQIRNLPISTDANLELPGGHCLESSERKKRGLGLRSSKHKHRKNSSSSIKDNGNNNGGGLLCPPPVERIHASASNPNLLTHANSDPSRPEHQLSPAHETRIQEIRLRENFVSTAEGVHKQLKGLLRMMFTERERLKNSLEVDSGAAAPSQQTVAVLRQALSDAHRQNADLRARLTRIHSESVVPELPPLTTVTSPVASPRLDKERVHLAQSVSGESFSLSEYYDAEENIETISDSSSEPSDDEASSDISEEGNDTDYTAGISGDLAEDQVFCATGRRTTLPVPKPETPDISLWNLLYRNIGKDLTKISMPVTLNEPLSMLQRLCEELEYSELLDKAADYDDPYERMIYVAAFAVSCYASSYYREGHKPFNPLLGETYECIREDKGWRFVAEQVSHHPPISACYCDSRNFKFWQDVRMKTKFWGKSMEIQPLGHVHVVLPKFRDHYKWNKVTTCVHNLLGGQRWADQYGEMTITNGNIVCKLTFTKGANSYSSKRYEVYGSITSSEGKVVHNLFGKWNEAFFCGHASSARCIWRPGVMPEDHELYYGFTRFAIELNELDMEQARFLPPTDSRFRPDQRLLEEGKISEAEAEKNRLENMQRERRKKSEDLDREQGPLWFQKAIQDGKEVYEYNGKYWEARKDPGFTKMTFAKIF